MPLDLDPAARAAPGLPTREQEIDHHQIFGLPCSSISTIITIFKVIMKLRLPVFLALAAAAQTLTSCCELPPLLCCPCYDGGYRPFGRPGTPGEAYQIGYLSGKHDARERHCRQPEARQDEVALTLRAYYGRGYDDGFVGRTRSDDASRIALEAVTKPARY